LTRTLDNYLGERAMPIIKAKQNQKKEQVRISLEKPLLEKIRQYCDWAGVSKTDEFFEQAAEFVLSKDKDWLNFAEQKPSA
jgi:hypothetical protein